jgi:hypothetical protein
VARFKGNIQVMQVIGTDTPAPPAAYGSASSRREQAQQQRRADEKQRQMVFSAEVTGETQAEIRRKLIALIEVSLADAE